MDDLRRRGSLLAVRPSRGQKKRRTGLVPARRLLPPFIRVIRGSCYRARDRARSLEHVAQRELNVAPVAILRDRAAEVRVGDVGLRPLRFGWLMKLNISTRNCIFCVPADAEVLEDRQIPLLVARVAEDVARRVAERAGRRIGEGRRVEDEVLSVRARRPRTCRWRSPSNRRRDPPAVRCRRRRRRRCRWSRVIENGVPVRKKLEPEICQPPSRFFMSVVGSRQNGRS